MLKKILKTTLLITTSLVLIAAVLYFATYPLVPKHFATIELKEFFTVLNEQGEEFLKRDLIDCSEFLKERNAWREDFEFLASLEENVFDVFLESWENERQCLYSQVDQSYDFIANYREGLKELNTDVTDFKDECDDIVYYSGKQLDIYDLYKENIDRQIDAEIERYSCRIGDRDYRYDGEELAADWLDVALSEWDDCEGEFLAKKIEIEMEFNKLWRDLMEKQGKTHEIIEKVNEGLEIEES